METKEMKYALIYKSYYIAIKKLQPIQQARMYSVLFDYIFDNNEPTFNDDELVIEISWDLMKPNIDNNIRNNKVKVNNGKKGGRPSNYIEKTQPVEAKKELPLPTPSKEEKVDENEENDDKIIDMEIINSILSDDDDLSDDEILTLFRESGLPGKAKIESRYPQLIVEFDKILSE